MKEPLREALDYATAAVTTAMVLVGPAAAFSLNMWLFSNVPGVELPQDLYVGAVSLSIVSVPLAVVWVYGLGNNKGWW